MAYQQNNVEAKRFKPYVKELILRCGSPEKASEYCGVGTSTLYRLRHDHHATLQRATAARILEALRKKRWEDRGNHRVSQELRKALQTQARIEENLERLSGY